MTDILNNRGGSYSGCCFYELTLDLSQSAILLLLRHSTPSHIFQLPGLDLQEGTQSILKVIRPNNFSEQVLNAMGKNTSNLNPKKLFIYRI